MLMRARTASEPRIAGRWTSRPMCVMAIAERAWDGHSIHHFSSSCVCKAFTMRLPASPCPTPGASAFTSRWDFKRSASIDTSASSAGIGTMWRGTSSASARRMASRRTHSTSRSSATHRSGPLCLRLTRRSKRTPRNRSELKRAMAQRPAYLAAAHSCCGACRSPRWSGSALAIVWRNSWQAEWQFWACLPFCAKRPVRNRNAWLRSDLRVLNALLRTLK